MYGAHSKFEEDRGRAIAWLQGGNTQRNVAVRLGVSQSVVGRLWQRFQAMNSVRNRPRSGRPRSTTNREDHYITNMALRQRTTTARRLRDNLRTATGTRVSDQTIRNRLRANNLRCRRQAVRPPLLPRHRTARRHWCTLHLRWQRVQWGRVMYTDESRFSIQFNTVVFVSTDVLGSASLTLTLDNVTGSVVAASWCGAASLSTTGPPSMW